jgi:hypothetical protein
MSAIDDLKASYPRYFEELLNLLHFMDDHEGSEFAEINHAIIPEDDFESVSFLLKRLSAYFFWRTFNRLISSGDGEAKRKIL